MAEHVLGMQILSGSPEYNSAEGGPSDTESNPDDDQAPPLTGTICEPPPRMIFLGFDIKPVVDLCIEVLADSGRIFLRGDALVDVPGYMGPVQAATEKSDESGPVYTIRAVPPARIMEILSSGAIFIQQKGKGDCKQVALPSWVVKAVHGRGHWQIPTLSGMTRIPVEYRPGKFLSVPGYDPESRLIYLPNHGPQTIPDAPTWEDAAEAVATLLDPVQDFPFASEVDKAAFVAATLTPFARPAIDGPTPFFFVKANIRSAGKGKLVDVIGQVVLGEDIPRLPQASSPAEERQEIFSTALGGLQMVLRDNIEGQFGSPAFNAMLTARTVQGRIMRTQGLRSAPMNAVWFGTGNNPVLRADLPRRTIFINLQSDEERPELRIDFEYPELIEHVRSIRESLISACLTILKAHALAGSPRLISRPLGSYECWDHLVREAVFWAMGVDPCERTVRGECQHDPERDALEVLVQTWQEAFPKGGGHYATAFADRVMGLGDATIGLLAAVRELSRREGEGDRGQTLGQSLGYILRNYQDRPVLGHRFVRQGEKDRNGIRWELIPIEGQSATPGRGGAMPPGVPQALPPAQGSPANPIDLDDQDGWDQGRESEFKRYFPTPKPNRDDDGPDMNDL